MAEDAGNAASNITALNSKVQIHSVLGRDDARVIVGILGTATVTLKELLASF
jgi:bifunctional ADP-heptose synthase (sugar kinase/adenylyltransferase)